MYKLPKNNNRTRSAGHKFENFEKNYAETAQKGCGNNLTKNLTFSFFYFRKYTIFVHLLYVISNIYYHFLSSIESERTSILSDN